MELLASLDKGLDNLEPFLNRYDFRVKEYENFKDSGSRFTFVKYKNEHKEFHLGYQFSIGHVVYQFENFAVSHDFYIDNLGFAKEKQYADLLEKKFIEKSLILEYKICLHR